MMAKLTSSTMLYPLDLIRTVQRASDTKINLLQIAKNVYKRDGIIGLYRGSTLYNSISTLNFMIMMSVIEATKSHLIDHNRCDE